MVASILDEWVEGLLADSRPLFTAEASLLQPTASMTSSQTQKMHGPYNLLLINQFRQKK
jgi:hypothetical protein